MSAFAPHRHEAATPTAASVGDIPSPAVGTRAPLKRAGEPNLLHPRSSSVGLSPRPPLSRRPTTRRAPSTRTRGRNRVRRLVETARGFERLCIDQSRKERSRAAWLAGLPAESGHAEDASGQFVSMAFTVGGGGSQNCAHCLSVAMVSPLGGAESRCRRQKRPRTRGRRFGARASLVWLLPAGSAGLRVGGHVHGDEGLYPVVEKGISKNKRAVEMHTRASISSRVHPFSTGPNPPRGNSHSGTLNREGSTEGPLRYLGLPSRGGSRGRAIGAGKCGAGITSGFSRSLDARPGNGQQEETTRVLHAFVPAGRLARLEPLMSRSSPRPARAQQRSDSHGSAAASSAPRSQCTSSSACGAHCPLPLPSVPSDLISYGD